MLLPSKTGSTELWDHGCSWIAICYFCASAVRPFTDCWRMEFRLWNSPTTVELFSRLCQRYNWAVKHWNSVPRTSKTSPQQCWGKNVTFSWEKSYAETLIVDSWNYFWCEGCVQCICDWPLDAWPSLVRLASFFCLLLLGYVSDNMRMICYNNYLSHEGTHKILSRNHNTRGLHINLYSV